MIDLKLDDSFNVSFGGGRDLQTVTGRELLEQQLRVAVGTYFERLVGARGAEQNVLNKVELEARRVAEDLDFVDELTSVRVSLKDDTRGVNAVIELQYDTGETAELTI